MKIICEPSKEIPVVAECDVAVVGGGPGGIMAALAAARTGAKTLLVERYGCLGGLATGGLVLQMDGMVDGKRERQVGGLGWEIIGRLRSMGGVAEESPLRIHVDSELLKVLADRLCMESGVELRLRQGRGHEHLWPAPRKPARTSGR